MPYKPPQSSSKHRPPPPPLLPLLLPLRWYHHERIGWWCGGSTIYVRYICVCDYACAATLDHSPSRDASAIRVTATPTHGTFFRSGFRFHSAIGCFATTECDGVHDSWVEKPTTTAQEPWPPASLRTLSSRRTFGSACRIRAPGWWPVWWLVGPRYTM